MLFSGLLIWGILSLNKLSISLMPPTESPALTIVTKYPGVAPSRIEEILTKPMEEQIIGVGGIESIYSSSEEGESRINIMFQSVDNLTLKSVDIKSKIDLIRDSFPREVEEPTVIRYDPSDRPIFIVKLESPVYSLKDLRDYAENKIKKRLERVDGVSEIRVGGGHLREINVEIDRGVLNFFNLPLSDVMNQLRQANLDLPSGKIRVNKDWVNARVLGKYSAVKEIENITITSKGDKLVKIKDFAEVFDGQRDREDISRENGNENVTIYVQKAGDANTLLVCKELEEELKQVSLRNIQQEITYNQATFIDKSISRVTNSAIFGGLIATFIIYLFLRNYKATLIVAISIPLSIFITFAVMYISGTGINVMTLSGLALGAGLLIDNSVVMLDRIFYLNKHRPTYTLEENIDFATLSLYKELFASTFTNVAVFIPFLFGSRELNQLYGGMALTVSISLIISLIVSVIFLPMIAKTILTRSQNNSSKNVVIVKNLDRYFKKFNFRIKIDYLRLETIRKRYIRSMIYCLKYPKPLVLIIIAMLIISIIIIPFMKQEYIDPVDAGEIRASVELETGVHLDATSERVENIEEQLRSVPDVEKVTSKVEKWHADLYIKLKDLSERNKSSQELIVDFKELTDKNPDAFVYYVESGAMDNSRELDIEFIGDDSDLLKKIASESAEKLKNIPGVQNVVLRFRQGKIEFLLKVFQDKLALSGLTSENMGSYIRTGIQGSIPTKFIDDSKEIDIRVRFREEDRLDLTQVEAYLIPGKKNVSVRELSIQQEADGETKIYRKNKRRIATITAKIGDLDLGTAVSRIQDVLSDVELPDNYYFELGDSYKKLKQNQYEMMFMILLALFLIFTILASLFQSLKLPWIILLSVPLGVLSVFIILFILNMSLNVSVYIGFILLSGITINNSIMIVERAEYYSSGNKTNTSFSLAIAIARASRERLRPILMTTLTTVMALCPTMLDFGEGSQLWRPLAITVFFGLSFSTVLTLFIVPIFYFFMNKPPKIKEIRTTRLD